MYSTNINDTKTRKDRMGRKFNPFDIDPFWAIVWTALIGWVPALYEAHKLLMDIIN